MPSLNQTLILAVALQVSMFTERCEAAPEPSAKQLGESLCNIAPPANIIRDNSVGAQLALDLSKIAKIGGSGSIGTTVNNKVASLFQAIPQRDVVCQMLLQSIACATAMRNDTVVSALTGNVKQSCHSEKPLNSPERAQIFERITILNSEIAAQSKQIERLDPRTTAAGKEWQTAKALAERATDATDRARLTAESDRLEQIYWAAYRTEEWFRDERLKRQKELASLRARVE